MRKIPRREKRLAERRGVMFACTAELTHAKGMTYVRLPIRRNRPCAMCTLLSNQITPPRCHQRI